MACPVIGTGGKRGDGDGDDQHAWSHHEKYDVRIERWVPPLSRRPPVPNADRCSPSRSRSGNLRAQVEGRGSGGFERALARLALDREYVHGTSRGPDEQGV